MAVATVAQMRTALALALTTKLGSADQQISGYVLKQPTLPTIWVRLQPNTPIEYHQAMGPPTSALAKWTFMVEAFCGDITERATQERLDTYISPGAKCVFEALEADTTLGGVVKNLIVRTCNAYTEFRRANGTIAAGANWLVEVYP